MSQKSFARLRPCHGRILALQVLLIFCVCNPATFAMKPLPLATPQLCKFLVNVLHAGRTQLDPEAVGIVLEYVEGRIELPFRLALEDTPLTSDNQILEGRFPGLDGAIETIRRGDGKKLRYVELKSQKTSQDALNENLQKKVSKTNTEALNLLFQTTSFEIAEKALEGSPPNVVTYEYNAKNLSPLQNKTEVEISIVKTSGQVSFNVEIHTPRTQTKLTSPLVLGIVQDGKVIDVRTTYPSNGYYVLPRNKIPSKGKWEVVVFGF